jgi:hypothetical protein
MFCCVSRNESAKNDWSPNFIAVKPILGLSIKPPPSLPVGVNSFLAQAIVGTHKKGVFFEIEANSKIKVTQARSCLLIECKNRNLALTDAHVAIASEQTADGYGIVSLILSTTHFDANERFIPGFVATQPVVIPNYLIDANNVVTKVTGKFGGNGIVVTKSEIKCWLKLKCVVDKVRSKIPYPSAVCLSATATRVSVKVK